MLVRLLVPLLLVHEVLARREDDAQARLVERHSVEFLPTRGDQLTSFATRRPDVEQEDGVPPADVPPLLLAPLQQQRRQHHRPRLLVHALNLGERVVLVARRVLSDERHLPSCIRLPPLGSRCRSERVRANRSYLASVGASMRTRVARRHLQLCCCGRVASVRAQQSPRFDRRRVHNLVLPVERGRGHRTKGVKEHHRMVRRCWLRRLAFVARVHECRVADA